MHLLLPDDRELPWSEGRVRHFAAKPRATSRFVRPREQVFNMDWQPPADQIDWEDLHLRVERPTSTQAEYGAM